jgi:undecaprenyl-diphosphatase
MLLAPVSGASAWQVLDSFDGPIVTFFNSFAHRSWTVDRLIYLVHFNPLLRAGPVLALVWWCWFKDNDERRTTREFLLYAWLATGLAVCVARALAFVLPFRERPLRNPTLHFQLPYGMTQEHLIGWSSFPSDTSAIYFAIATGLLLVSRRAGTAALFYVFVTVFLPRIYLGIHYPSDMAAGALIGIGVASLARASTLRTRLTRPAMRWLDNDPASFYPCAIVFTYQLTEAFNPVFEVGGFLVVTARAMAGLWR